MNDEAGSLALGLALNSSAWDHPAPTSRRHRTMLTILYILGVVVVVIYHVTIVEIVQGLLKSFGLW